MTGQEAISLMTIAEMREGGNYGEGNIYEGERVYGVLGEDLLAFGTLIFGNSPFGLRFFPMLCAAAVSYTHLCAAFAGCDGLPLQRSEIYQSV